MSSGGGRARCTERSSNWPRRWTFPASEASDIPQVPWESGLSQGHLHGVETVLQILVPRTGFSRRSPQGRLPRGCGHALGCKEGVSFFQSHFLYWEFFGDTSKPQDPGCREGWSGGEGRGWGWATSRAGDGQHSFPCPRPPRVCLSVPPGVNMAVGGRELPDKASVPKVEGESGDKDQTQVGAPAGRFVRSRRAGVCMEDDRCNGHEDMASRPP